MTPDLTDGIKWYLAFVFSTSLHEASHAWAALKLGDDTAHKGGQVTLDPTPHIRRAPFGMVVVPIASFLLGGWMVGWAGAPYSVQWALQYPRRAALMSLAGPASNLLLVIISALLIRAGIAFHVFEAPLRIGPSHITEAMAPGIYLFLAKVLSIMFSLNLLLCTFNLLPLPPLDGSGLLFFFTGRESAARLFQFLHHPTLSSIGLVISWQVFNSIFPSIQLFAANLLYPGAGYH